MPYRHLALAFTIAAALVPAIAPAAASEPGLVAEVVALVNEARATSGLAPLTADQELTDVARQQVEAIRRAGALFHGPPRAPGERWWRLAENVGGGASVAGVHDAFLDSPGHRAAILGPFHHIGAAVIADGSVLWVVVEFGELRRPAPPSGDGVGYVDTVTGRWQLPGGPLTYGNPGDVPMLGDWDCDGVATPGLYRRSDGYVYLRNSNSSGVADVRFYFGDPGDVPIAGDFDGDGCDTVSLYRPGTGRVHLIDRLGSGRQGLGAADRSYAAGAGEPLAGDFDGDGRDDVALHHRAGGRITVHHARHAGGGQSLVRAFGDPGDVLVAADWDGDARAELAAFRPAAGTIHFEDGRVAAAPRGSRWVPVAVP